MHACVHPHSQGCCPVQRSGQPERNAVLTTELRACGAALAGTLRIDGTKLVDWWLRSCCFAATSWRAAAQDCASLFALPQRLLPRCSKGGRPCASHVVHARAPSLELFGPVSCVLVGWAEVRRPLLPRDAPCWLPVPATGSGCSTAQPWRTPPAPGASPLMARAATPSARPLEWHSLLQVQGQQNAWLARKSGTCAVPAAGHARCRPCVCWRPCTAMRACTWRHAAHDEATAHAVGVCVCEQSKVVCGGVGCSLAGPPGCSLLGGAGARAAAAPGARGQRASVTSSSLAAAEKRRRALPWCGRCPQQPVDLVHMPGSRPTVVVVCA
jgi:hypothetical protein